MDAPFTVTPETNPITLPPATPKPSATSSLDETHQLNPTALQLSFSFSVDQSGVDSFPTRTQQSAHTPAQSSGEDIAALLSFRSLVGGNLKNAQELLEARHLSPTEYRETIDSLRAASIASQQTIDIGMHNSVGERAAGARPENYVHCVSKDDPILSTYSSFLECGVYNRPFDSERRHNLNLRWEALQPLREELLHRLHRDDIVAILPFVAERQTAHLNVQYALETVGNDSVLAVSAVQDSKSEINVQHVISGTNSQLVSQEQILSCFDWKLIGEKCSIPTISRGGTTLPPVGGKGLTMLAGVAVAALQDRLHGRFVFFSDTDFVRPSEYDSFAHLAVPLVLGSASAPRLIKTAKTGPGRNNEAWTREANLLATDPLQSELTRGVALLCQQFIWPLSGNLAMRGDDLYCMHFATGAGIETQINTYFAGRQLERGVCEVAQVCNPNPVVEDGESRPVRESAMIGRCQMWLRSVLTSIGRFDKPIHQWSLKEIREFNATFGGTQHWGAFQDAAHAPQTPSKITLDYMIPSIRICALLGAIDWERMLCICSTRGANT